MLHFVVISALLIAVAIGSGLGFVIAVRKAMVAYQRIHTERRANAFKREIAARQARMAKFSMTQFSGTKASERNW